MELNAYFDAERMKLSGPVAMVLLFGNKIKNKSNGRLMLPKKQRDYLTKILCPTKAASTGKFPESCFTRLQALDLWPVF